MDYLSGSRKASGTTGDANDINSSGLVFRGRTPRTPSNPNGFDAQIDIETQQPGIGMSNSSSHGVSRNSAGSGASAGLPYMQQHSMQHGSSSTAASQWQTNTQNERTVVAPPRRGTSLSSSVSTYEDDKNKKFRSSFSSPASASLSQGQSAFRSLFIGACLTCGLLGILSTVGFFNRGKTNSYVYTRPRSSSYASPAVLDPEDFDVPLPPKRALRGSVHNQVVTSEGSRIVQSHIDHHHSRVILIPSNEPFTRRNVHHFAQHGARLGTNTHRNESGNARAIHVDDMEEFVEDRREYVRHPNDVLLRDEDLHAMEATAHFPYPFITNGDVHKIEVAHGVDDHHDADSHDYFGSSMVNMGYNPATKLTTLAVGAPGALDTSGAIYFMDVNREGDVENYSYLTHEDFVETVGGGTGGSVSFGKAWGPNSALGWALENVGDLDGDGVNDLAVGALGYPAGNSKGAVFIFFLTAEHEIKSYKVITEGVGGFPHQLNQHWRFGSSVSRLGDLDGDGVTELAVGAMGMGKERGGVFVLFMNKDGTVKNTHLIASLRGWDHKLVVQDQFGSAVRGMGDLDGDGVPDMVVSGDGFPAGESYGAVWVLFLNVDGSVKYWRRLDEFDPLLEPEALFGASLASLGDLDGDGRQELLIGAPGLHELRGEAFIVSLDKEGRVRHYKTVTDSDSDLEAVISSNDEFGWSVTSLGDLDGDGVPDLAVAAETSPGETNHPSLYMLFLAKQDEGPGAAGAARAMEEKGAAAQETKRRLR